ncbi:hypothetical protein ACOZ4L_08870 [Haloplanus ruber]|uniref:Uncharacterized protein n=1 Tax=Haloplanus ruber TaxID=869892 RepID=A0ABD6CWP5_9EURY|nr:hypothetical protein [Haloplanus ruber]
MALGWSLLTAAADRSRLGRYLLYSAAVLAVVGIVWWVATGSDPLPAIPLLLFGLAIGFAANRLLFGVIRPVPEVRRARQRNS